MQVLAHYMSYFCSMLTPDEEKFVAYWAENRERKKKLMYSLAIGLPTGVAIVIAIFVNFFSGWYFRAEMNFRANSSGFIVLMIAALGIVIFITVFSARHKWDMNETRYRELLARKDKSD